MEVKKQVMDGLVNVNKDLDAEERGLRVFRCAEKNDNQTEESLWDMVFDATYDVSSEITPRTRQQINELWTN